MFSFRKFSLNSRKGPCVPEVHEWPLRTQAQLRAAICVKEPCSPRKTGKVSLSREAETDQKFSLVRLRVSLCFIQKEPHRQIFSFYFTKSKYSIVGGV